MCIWDDPGISTTRIRSATEKLSRGVYRSERHQSPFSIKSRAPDAFEVLFRAVRDIEVPMVLSYSPHTSNSVMRVDDIIAIARRYFGQVKAMSPGPISHSKLNTVRYNIAAPDDAEVLVLCR
jgi:adenine-specific DNA-methyltransferase